MDIYQLIDQIHLQNLEQLDESVESALFTEDHEALFQLGDTLLQYGLNPQGLKVFTRLFELYPDEPDVLAYYIECLIDDNQHDKAIEVLHHTPVSVERLMLEADIYQQQDMLEVAIEKVKQAYTLSSEDPIISFALAELYYFDGQYLPAARSYEYLINNGIDRVNNVFIQSRIADCVLQSGDYEEAVEHFEKIDEKELLSDDYFKMAISYQKADRIERSIQTLQTLLDKDPDYMQAYLLLVNLLESERKYNDAILVGQKGIRLNEFYKELLVDTGRIMIKMRNEKGVDYLIQALTIDPSYVEASLLLADYYREEEDFEALVQLFAYIDEEDIDPTVMWHLAYSYQQLEKDKEAKHFYSESYNVLKDNVAFLLDYYHYAREIADVQLAEHLYVLIHQIDPNVDIDA
ncbi:tetratricopeptide repeat protein [Macrococcoides caseolyticum]|uniref:tetratricopeptide repeat protein n=1 Tax=Macrococcoides caseolyticum TaxID=69966 RepID=UPI001F2E177B|nr:tetratricopeptide repeat protein [Macrococcus caseolyticus]MCE4957066.1 tetratricopeptide repeat protein [Macrococcus caseolyticus]